jgi:hypothetical protein
MPTTKCKRCGECCLGGPKNHWLHSKLTWKEQQELIAERKKYKENKGCLALYFDEVAYCLVQKMFGIEKKYKRCREWVCNKHENHIRSTDSQAG